MALASPNPGEQRSFGRSRPAGRTAAKGGWRAWLSTLITFWQKVNNDWVFNLSGLLAYNFLMSAFPILLVILAIGGFLLGATATGSQSSLAQFIVQLLPNGTGHTLLITVTHDLHRSAGVLFVVGLVVALFTGSNLFVTLENCFGIVFRLRSRSFIRQRLMSVGMLILYAVLIPVVLLASLVTPLLVHVLAPGNSALADFFIQAAGDAVAVLIAALLFGVIYVVVPNRSVKWNEVWKGTLVAALLLVIYEALFPIYVNTFLHPSNYGSTAGFAVVILLFFYYLAFIILLGAEINAWAYGQRATKGDIDTIIHDSQAQNAVDSAREPGNTAN